MTTRYTFAFSRHQAPEFCLIDPPNKGRGECRVPVAPAAARVVVGSTRVSHHGRTGKPGIPARDGVNGFLRALPGDRAFVVTVAGEISFANLTPASGRQDHTTSPSARMRSRQQRCLRPSHPNLTFVTIAKRPSVSGRDGENEEVSWVKSEAEYFCKGGWTCDAPFSFSVIPRCAIAHLWMRRLAQARNPYSL
jgi:hypothetical protein